MVHQRTMWALVVVVIGVYAHAAETSLSPEKQAVVQAANSGDDAALAVALESLAAIDVPSSVDYSFRILTNGAPHQRPVAVAALVKHASATELAAAATQLRPDLFHDERRELVRTIGLRKGKNVLPALAPFLRDQDVLVRAAAAAGIADLKDPAALALLLNPPPSLVDYTQIDGDGDDHLYAESALGAIRALSGLNAENTNAINDWWRRGGKPLNPPADAPWQASGNRPFAIKSFDIRFNPPEAREILARRFGIRSDGDWARLFKSMELAAEQDRRVAGKIFGPLYAPYCRIDFATHQTIAATGGVSEGYFGFAGDCLVTFNAETFPLVGWQVIFRHEYIHSLHFTQFVDQPRWLQEGLAVSLSESPSRTSWTPQRVIANGLAGVIGQGGVSADIKWINGAHTGESEFVQYALSGLVMDYLRFGGIPASEQRLYALMGELSRGAMPERAIESVYGVALNRLDGDFAKWVAKLSPDIHSE